MTSNQRVKKLKKFDRKFEEISNSLSDGIYEWLAREIGGRRQKYADLLVFFYNRT